MLRRSRCAKTRDRLSLYIDDRLDGERRREVEDHLASCARCREDLRTLEVTVALLHRVPQAKAPRSFAVPAPVPHLARGYSLARGFGLAAACAVFMLLGLLSAEMVLGARATSQTAAPLVAAPATGAGRNAQAKGAEAQASPTTTAADLANPAVGPRAAAPAAAPDPTALSTGQSVAGRSNATPTTASEVTGSYATRSEATPSATAAPKLTATAEAGPTLAPAPAPPTQGASDEAAAQPGLTGWRVAQLGSGSLAALLGVTWVVLRRRGRR